MWGWVARLAITLVFGAIAYFTRQRPEDPPAATREEFSVPNSREGLLLGEVDGTVLIPDARIAWDGDFATKAIRKSTSKK